MMHQDFEFFIIPENKWCFNCIMQQYCDLKNIVGSCDRWGQGPAWTRGTREYNEVLLDIYDKIVNNKIKLPECQDVDGYEYYTNLFLKAVF